MQQTLTLYCLLSAVLTLRSVLRWSCTKVYSCLVNTELSGLFAWRLHCFMLREKKESGGWDLSVWWEWVGQGHSELHCFRICCYRKTINFDVVTVILICIELHHTTPLLTSSFLFCLIACWLTEPLPFKAPVPFFPHECISHVTWVIYNTAWDSTLAYSEGLKSKVNCNGCTDSIYSFFSEMMNWSVRKKCECVASLCVQHKHTLRVHARQSPWWRSNYTGSYASSVAGARLQGLVMCFCSVTAFHLQMSKNKLF